MDSEVILHTITINFKNKDFTREQKSQIIDFIKSVMEVQKILMASKVILKAKEIPMFINIIPMTIKIIKAFLLVTNNIPPLKLSIQEIIITIFIFIIVKQTLIIKAEMTETIEGVTRTSSDFTN